MSYEEIRQYDFADISIEKMVASAKPADLHDSVVQTKQQYHHNMCFPSSDKEKGKFDIQLPQSISSSINETTGEDGKTKSFYYFVDIYSNYFKHFKTVKDKIDNMLRAANDGTTPEQLKTLLFASLRKLSKKDAEIQKAFAETLRGGKILNTEYFRYIVNLLVLPDELAKDTLGTNLIKGFTELKRAYCETLDKLPDVKEKIYTGVGIAPEKLDEPSANLVDDIVQYPKYAKDHKTMPRMIDFSKSPQIQIKIMESVPKDEKQKNRKDLIVIGKEKGQVLWTTVYDYHNDQLAEKPISTYDQFNFFLYRKGDSAAGNKTSFKLQQATKITTPSIYWGEVQKRGVFQFKATVLKIFKYIPIAGSSRVISKEERDRDFEAARAFMAYCDYSQYNNSNNNDDNDQENQDGNKSYDGGFGGQAEADDETGEEIEVEKKSLKRNPDDIDSLIEADQEQQQQKTTKQPATKKARHK